MENLFPPAPADIPADIAAPSAAFRREVRGVITGLAFFAFVYLLLVVLAGVLTAVCIYLGLAIIALRPSLFTILIGAGLIFMGCMVLFFLIKFIFASEGADVGSRVELQEADEPVLFDFIRRTAAEVGTHFPKKVVLTPDVNASVSYSSNFLSLFFPVRKNLTIGLGLVNSVNVSEFKAVLAHEFGHFSQKSMKLGSYVYYINRVIYNLLFHNDKWAGAVDGIAGVHAILAFFAQLAVRIVVGIQWILRKLYALINLRQRGLSRAMEFQADAISASVSGSNNAVAALRRIEFGSAAYGHTIEHCQSLAGAGQKAGNFYHWQQRTAAVLAAEHTLPLRHGLPVISDTFLAGRVPPRVVYKDQWASHPTQAEREDALNHLGVKAEVIDEPAWRLFRQVERWQRDLTAMMYAEAPADWTEHPAEELTIELGNGLAREYRGYYDRLGRTPLDVEALQAKGSPSALSAEAFEGLFSERLPDRILALHQDIETLQGIENESIDAQSFDFDGEKYTRSQAAEIRARLEAENEMLIEALENRRREAAQAFYDAALAESPATAEALLTQFRAFEAARSRLAQVIEAASPILQVVYHFQQREFFLHTEDTALFHQLVQHQEPAWRALLTTLLSQHVLPTAAEESAGKFLAKPADYKTPQGLHQTNLIALHQLAVEVYQATHELYLGTLKEMLAKQSALVDLRKPAAV